MENKIQQLTEKLYNEGLAKGREESERLVREAAQEASRTVADARKQADDIVARAKAEAEEIRRNAASDMLMASRQALTDLKQRIENLVSARAVSAPVREAYDDKTFLRTLMVEVVKGWKAGGDAAPDLNVLVPADQLEELKQYLDVQTDKALSAGVDLVGDNGLKNGFRIQPKDGGYYISFTEADFDALFREYLRPRLAERLFGGK